MLLKRDGEVQRHIQRYSATIEHAKNTQATPAKSRPTRARISDCGELRQIRDEIQREKMEILALENMLSELEAAPAQPAASRAETPRAAASPAPAEGPTSPERARPAARSPARGLSASVRSPGPRPASQRPTARTPGPQTPSKAGLAQSTSGRTPERTPATARLRRTLDGTPRLALSQSVSETPAPRRPLSRSVASPATPQRRMPASPAARTAASPATRTAASPAPRAQASPVRPPTRSPAAARSAQASPARPALLPPGQAPEPTPELERIAAQLWTQFGESLRYATSDERASFADTFAILSLLECCGQDPATAQSNATASPDDSVRAPSGVSSLSTQSGAPLQPSTPLGVNTVVMAHVILLLFRAPAPHTLTLPNIKTLTDSWWRQRGQGIFRATATSPALAVEPIRHVGLDMAEVELGGDALGSRAVYGLVAKKILRIHRAGGAATIRFA